MRVIAAVGKNASGKDAFVERLSLKYGIQVFSTGDFGRELAKKAGIPATRENLHAIAHRQMTKFGQFVFPDAVIAKIRASGLAYAAVTGIRPYSDVMRFRAAFGESFVLVHIAVSNDSVRFERARGRGSERDATSLVEFLRHDQREEELFNTSRTAAAADYVIKNDRGLNEFLSDIDDFAATVLKLGSDNETKSSFSGTASDNT